MIREVGYNRLISKSYGVFMSDSFFKLLWPEGGGKQKLQPVTDSSAKVKLPGPAAPKIAGGGEPINITVGGTLIPPKDIGYFKFTLELAGQMKIVAGTPTASHQFEGANEFDVQELYSFVGKYQTEIAKGVAFEGSAALNGDFYEKFRQGKWKSAFAGAIGARFKTSGNVFPGQDAVQWGVEVDLTPSLCPFGITFKLVLQTPTPELQTKFSWLPKGVNVQLEVAVRVGVGLSLRGWAAVLQVIGDASARQAIRSFPQKGVHGALLSQLATASGAAAGVGAGAGVAGFYFGMAWIAATASKGKKLGILRNYCLGFVTAVFERGANRRGQGTNRRGHLAAGKLRGSRETDRHFQGGYYDAKYAMGKNQHKCIEEALIKKFPVYRMAGSTWWRYQKQVDVGSHIDNEDEVRMIADEMAEFLLANQSEINEFLDLSGADWSWF